MLRAGNKGSCVAESLFARWQVAVWEIKMRLALLLPSVRSGSQHQKLHASAAGNAYIDGRSKAN